MDRFAHGYALLIGVDENSVSDWALPAVTKDITALSAVLTHPERCAYPPEQVKILHGKEATRQGILEGLDWLQERLQADPSGNATAILHYSGHGWRDETTNPPAYYLIPYDVRRDNLQARALRAEDFAEVIRGLNPRRLLVILDCCHAGGMEVRNISAAEDFVEAALPTSLMMSADPVPTSPTGFNRLEAGHGRAVLSSSQGEQPSYNRRDGRMGIFTYHLIEALTGHAQPQEGAGEVLVSDVMSYVWRQVPKSAQADWGEEQQPEYQVSGNFPIALLIGGKGLAPGQPAPDPLETLPITVVNTAGGDFIGRDKVIQGDEIRGDKVAGDKVTGDRITVGDVSGIGIAIGRNAAVSVSFGAPEVELETLFAPVFAAVRGLPPEEQVTAQQAVEALKSEVARGRRAEDSRMASLLDGLASSAPTIARAAAQVFTSPSLAALAGPVTKFMLEKIQSGR